MPCLPRRAVTSSGSFLQAIGHNIPKYCQQYLPTLITDSSLRAYSNTQHWRGCSARDRARGRIRQPSFLVQRVKFGAT
jgi:hypothetical protein